MKEREEAKAELVVLRAFAPLGGRKAVEEARPEPAGGCYVITTVVAVQTLAYGQGRPP